MYYTIYKITNKINGKVYIGKHQTKDLGDGYMGSGKYLKHAIEKYGLENFSKEILYIFNNEDEMNSKEAELVDEEFVKEDSNYNLCPGGQGGFGYINENRDSDYYVELSKKGNSVSTEKRILASKANAKKGLAVIEKLALKESFRKARAAKARPKLLETMSKQETRDKMSRGRKGRGVGKENSQYGKRYKWLNNGRINRKVLVDDVDSFLTNGFVYGRINTR